MLDLGLIQEISCVRKNIVFKYPVGTDVYKFIDDHLSVIQGMVYEAKTLLAKNDYPNEDEHLLSACSIVGLGMIAGTTDLEDAVDFEVKDQELLYRVVHSLFVNAIIWSLEEKGLATANNDGTFTVHELGMKALKSAKTNLAD